MSGRYPGHKDSPWILDDSNASSAAKIDRRFSIITPVLPLALRPARLSDGDISEQVDHGRSMRADMPANDLK